MKKISIKLLEKFVEELINELYKKGIKEIEMFDDYYWEIDDADKFDVIKKPNVELIGQISDDYDFIEKSLEHDFMLGTNDFHRIAAIFRLIGKHYLNLY